MSMEPLKASRLCVVEGVEKDQRAADRAAGLQKQLQPDVVETVDDERLCEIMNDPDIVGGGRHGIHAEIDPVVIFNIGRFNDSAELKEDRLQQYPKLNSSTYPLSGYESFFWRRSGSPDYRRQTANVCDPAYQLHTAWGCHYRCSYCSLGHYVTLMMNLEEFVERLPDIIADRAPHQRLFQYDNGTDIVAFEPEYGASKLLIKFFAERDDQFLELYVGKSANVNHLLDIDHRGHTVCCWSLSGRTQSTEIEWNSAPVEERIRASRKCQQAGYHVRHRFSPIVPVRNWRQENREMIEKLFDALNPDLVTFETLRFIDYDALMESFDPELLDPEFLEVMRQNNRDHVQRGDEIPQEYRWKIYRFIIDELERVSPETPYALCREKRTTWEHFADDFARHDQHPDDYMCNCGPRSAPGDPRLATTADIA